MPLLKFDIVKGRTSEQIQKLLDAAHRALLTSFKVPTRDRYQLFVEHDASHLVVQDTGISIVTNSDEDWSLGLGEAQFLTKAL